MPDPVLKQVRMSARALTAHYEAFVNSLRRGAPETRGTYTRALREFVRWFARDGSFRFTVRDVRRYKQYLSTKKKLSDVSVSTYLTALRRFCAYLVRRDILADSPARYVGGNSRPAAHSREYLTAEDIRAVLAAVPGSDLRGRRDYAMILLMIHCGLSEIELVRADVGDVERRGDGWEMAVQGKGHTRKDERITLPPGVKEAVDLYRAVRGNAGAGEPLFASAGNRTRGRRMTTRGVRDRINAILVQAGLKRSGGRHVTPYSLRHTAAVLMAQGGATAEEIRRRMRLGSTATAELYLHHLATHDDHKPSIAEDHHGALSVQHN